jgi:fructose-bisphosphate aldolase class II
VFHGGSGSALSEIHEALDYGVVKMNVDTDMQYAFTRAVAGHMFKNYDGALKVDAKWATRKSITRAPTLRWRKRRWRTAKQAVSDLRGPGTTMFSS